MFNKNVILFVLGIFTFTYGATLMGDGTNADDLKHCHINREDGTVFKVPAGTDMTDKETCIHYTCENLSLTKRLYYSAETCPLVELHPGYVLMYDESKAYPGCCPYVVKSEKVEEEQKESIWRKLWKKIKRS